MQIKLFTIPISNHEPFLEEMNRFMRGHKVIEGLWAESEYRNNILSLSVVISHANAKAFDRYWANIVEATIGWVVAAIAAAVLVIVESLVAASIAKSLGATLQVSALPRIIEIPILKIKNKISHIMICDILLHLQYESTRYRHISQVVSVLSQSFDTNRISCCIVYQSGRNI